MVLHVRFLLEQYHGKEWPPSPRRVFLAMVSALYQSRGRHVSKLEGEKALRFLECLQPPVIMEPKHSRAPKQTMYVQNNDHDKISAKYEKSKHIKEAPGWEDVIKRSSMTDKAMQPVYMHGPVSYVWEANFPEDIVQAMDKLAKEVYAIGWGIDAATMQVELLHEQPVPEHPMIIHNPVQGNWGHMLHVPMSGLLEDAAQRHNRTVERRREFDLDKSSGYYNTPQIRRSRAQWYTRSADPVILLGFRVSAVSGHTQNSVPEENMQGLLDGIPHVPKDVQAVAIPSVGSWSDLGIRRVGLLCPPHVDRRQILDTADCAFITVSETTYQITHLDDDKVVKELSKKSKTWRSPYPVALGVRNDASRQVIVQKICDMVSPMLRRSLEAVDFRRTPYMHGGNKVSKGNTDAYVEIVFGNAVSGPIALDRHILVPVSPGSVVAYEITEQRPTVDLAAPLGNALKLAVMSKIRRRFGSGSIPGEISGHDELGRAVRGGHMHASWLPVDTDGDGLLDRIFVYIPKGLGRQLIDSAIFESVRMLSSESGISANVRFTGMFGRTRLTGLAPYFKKSTRWVSASSYRMPRNPKPRYGPKEQIQEELKRRFNADASVMYTPISDHALDHRGIRIKRTGYNVSIRFFREVSGPVMCGHECHFGRGLFRPDTS